MGNIFRNQSQSGKNQSLKNSEKTDQSTAARNENPMDLIREAGNEGSKNNPKIKKKENTIFEQRRLQKQPCTEFKNRSRSRNHSSELSRSGSSTGGKMFEILTKQTISQSPCSQNPDFGGPINCENPNRRQHVLSGLFGDSLSRPQNDSSHSNKQRKKQANTHKSTPRLNAAPNQQVRPLRRVKSCTSQNLQVRACRNQLECDDRSYTVSELDKYFAFLEAFSFEDPKIETHFNRLSQNSLILLSLRFEKLYKLSSGSIRLESFQDFRKTIFGANTKRTKEEMLKMVYKNTLKALQTKFSYKYTAFMLQHNTPTFKVFLKNNKSLFYLYMFRNTITDRHIHRDLLMDILFEKVTCKKPRITPENNWTQDRKPESMKTISTSVRYLIKQDTEAKRRVMELIEDTNDPGLVIVMKNVTRKILRTKKNYWRRVLKENSYDFAKFKSIYVSKLESPKFRSPWTISDVKQAIDICQKELASPDDAALKKDFLLIQKHHYTSISDDYESE